MPEHAPYVKADGAFDMRAATDDIIEETDSRAVDAILQAKKMAIEWAEAFRETSKEVGSRLN